MEGGHRLLSHNVPNNTHRTTELKKLTGVSETFYELNFCILFIKFKKDKNGCSENFCLFFMIFQSVGYHVNQSYTSWIPCSLRGMW